MPNGSLGTEQACAFNSVKGCSGELDPLFYPAGFEFRRVPVPNARKQCDNVAGDVYLRVKLTRNIQLLRGLDLRAVPTFYVPFALIKSVTFGLESEPLGSSPPPVLVCDPQ